MKKSGHTSSPEPLPAQPSGRSAAIDESALHDDPLIARLLPIINDQQSLASPLYDDFTKMFHAYIRQARRMKRIISISDNYQSQLQDLQTRLKGAVEVEERSRLYRDLHDGASQSLHAVRLHLMLLADGKGGYDDPRQLAAELAQEIADVATELHDIANQLRPSFLLDITLDKAIVKRCEMLRRRGVPIEVTCGGDFASLPHVVCDNLYRIAQEALANASRHAGAGLIKLNLTCDAHEIRLVIADDGCGLEDNRMAGNGLGLRIMQERADLIDAKFSITSSSSGTAITAIREIK